MGNCLRSSALTIRDDTSYPCEVSLALMSPSKRVKIRLPSPSLASSQTLKLGSLLLTSTTCVLPGTEITSGTGREAQEAAFHMCVEECALVGVFDGHGKDGKKVVEFCSEWFQSYFKQHKEEFRTDARSALSRAFERCDAAVKIEVECMLSGR